MSLLVSLKVNSLLLITKFIHFFVSEVHQRLTKARNVLLYVFDALVVQMDLLAVVRHVIV